MDQNIPLSEAISRITQLLDCAYSELMIAQKAVDYCLNHASIDCEETNNIQKLDLATQIVEAITKILKNLLTLYKENPKGNVNLTKLHDGVELGFVLQHLYNDKCTQSHIQEQHHASGEIDLF